jgi:methanogenic corrinoid protein MtbC1
VDAPEETRHTADFQDSCSFGTASRLTGLSHDLLRAWERRYRAVEPLRTAGGTRRYRTRDLRRLRALKAAVDAGHRIGRIARLDDAELARLANAGAAPPGARFEEVFAAVDRLDGGELNRLLSQQFAALGPQRFASEFAGPLMHEIGERWADGRCPIAGEHLTTGCLRSILGAAYQSSTAEAFGPRVVFGTIPGERHELGLQMAALTALGAGVTPVYLGSDVPVDELVATAERTRADAVALSFVATPTQPAQAAISAIRGRLRRAVECWIGGFASAEIELVDGVERFHDLVALEKRAMSLAVGWKGSR